MFEKNLKIVYLLDFYGEALDEHTRNVMNAYYEDDLSLSEIAEDCGISRQGVRHVIKKGEEQLLFLEDALKLAEYHKELTVAEDLLRQTLSPSAELCDGEPSLQDRVSAISDGIRRALEIIEGKGE